MYRRAGALALVAVTMACGSRSRLLDPGVSAGATGGAGAVGGTGGSSAGGAGGSSAGGAGGIATGGASSGGNGGSAGCYAEVVAGGYHTCARTPLGHVYCFGANQFGQLGNGATQDSSNVPEPIVGPGDFVALGAGEYHSSGIRAAGFMMSWGHNPLGVLGDGTTTDQPFAVAMKGPGDAVAMSQGMVAYQACALHGNGSVTCWGQNDHGELGNGGFTPSLTQVPVVGLEDAVSVAVGYIFSCAVEWNGNVKCWGWNASGALGIGNLDAQSYSKPVSVLGVQNALQVVAGNHYGCARTDSGQVYCWGYNGSGQLGLGSSEEHSPTPALVPGLSDVVWLSGGRSHVCAVHADGTLSCWGRNYFGQLGDGTTEDRNAPVKVEALGQVTRVSAGGEHTCALSQSQGLVCWGANESGQLGIGTTEKSLVPQQVSCP